MNYFSISGENRNSKKVFEHNFFSNAKSAPKSGQVQGNNFHEILRNKISHEKLKNRSSKIFFPAKFLGSINFYNHISKPKTVVKKQTFSFLNQAKIDSRKSIGQSDFITAPGKENGNHFDLFSNKLSLFQKNNVNYQSRAFLTKYYNQIGNLDTTLIKSSYNFYKAHKNFYSAKSQIGLSTTFANFVSNRIEKFIKNQPSDFKNINLQIKFQNLGKMHCSIFKTGTTTNIKFRTETDELSNILRQSLPSIKANLKRKGFFIKFPKHI